MVACEICDNWFHLRCVGLREDDELPKNFMCSDCVAEGFIGSASEDWIMEAAEHGPAEKVLPKRQRRIGKPAAQRKSSDKTLPKGDAVVRGKVRDKLTEALSGSEGAANSKAAEEAAGRVEEALLRCYEGTGPDYKKKARDLAFNFADSLNSSLRVSVVRGATAAEEVVQMSNTELANEQTRIHAAAIEREKVRQSRKHHVKLDQSTMDKDGTVHWVEAEPGDGDDAADNRPGAPIAGAVAAVATEATAVAAAYTATEEETVLEDMRSQGFPSALEDIAADADEKTPTATPTSPHLLDLAPPADATADLLSQEQRLLAQIAALQPDVVSKLPAAQRKQFEDIVRQRRRQQQQQGGEQ